jgi:hypothetical protein
MYDKTLLSGARSIRSLALDLVEAARGENMPNEIINSTVRDLNALGDRLEAIHASINGQRGSRRTRDTTTD